MSQIDDLVKQLCPDGVPVKRLSEVGRFVRGNGLPKTDFTESGVGAIHYGQIYTYYNTWTTETISFVSPETAARLAKVEPGDVIITNTSENLEDVGKSIAWLGSEQIVTGGHATIFKHSQNPKFIAYWFQSPEFFAQKKKRATGAKVIDVSAKALESVLIPVPPLEVQAAVVTVLDTFRSLKSQLDRELSDELTARQRQYTFYRDALLAFEGNDEVAWRPMGELGQFIRGRRFTKGDVVDTGIASIHYGEIYTHYGTAASVARSHVREDLGGQLRFAQPGDVVIAAVGETVEDVGKAVAWLGDEPVAVHDDCFIFRHSMNPKFVSYYLQTEAFHSQKARHVARAKVKRLSGENLAKLTMPVPSSTEQDRIVATLDVYEKVLAELSTSLPLERVVRTTQYEHYRDRLLTFQEAVA